MSYVNCLHVRCGRVQLVDIVEWQRVTVKLSELIQLNLHFTHVFSSNQSEVYFVFCIYYIMYCYLLLCILYFVV